MGVRDSMYQLVVVVTIRGEYVRPHAGEVHQELLREQAQYA